MNRRVCALVLVQLGIAGFPFAWAFQASDPSTLTKEQRVAVARAEEFLRDIARMSPVKDEGNPDLSQAWPRAPIKVTRSLDGTEVRHPRTLTPKVVPSFRNGLWRVEFYDGEVAVTVDPHARRVLGYQDSTVWNVLSSMYQDTAAPAQGARITRQEALERAIAYLKCAGIYDRDMLVRYVRLSDYHQPVTIAGQRWWIDWDKVWRGIPYEQRGATVVEAGKGRLIVLGGGGSSAIPRNPELRLDPEAALKAAQRIMAEEGYRCTRRGFARLLISRPKQVRKRPREWEKAEDGSVHLTWHVYQPVERTNAIGTMYEGSGYLLIDAGNAEPLGLEMSGLAPPLEGHYSLYPILTFASSFSIAPIGGRDRKRTVTAKENPHRFYGAVSWLLPASIDDSPIAFAATHDLLVYSSTGEAKLQYDSARGMIGDEKGNYVYANQALRELLVPGSTANGRW